MQRLIDANKLIYERCDDSATRATFDFVRDDDIEDAETVLTIPDNPTNGDMVKAIFPNAEFDNAMPFTDGRWETMNLDTENRIRAIYKPTQLRTYVEWWNAPYKAESEK